MPPTAAFIAINPLPTRRTPLPTALLRCPTPPHLPLCARSMHAPVCTALRTPTSSPPSQHHHQHYQKHSSPTQSASDYLLYVLPTLILLSPAATLAQSTAASSSSSSSSSTAAPLPIDDVSVTPLSSRILGWTAFLLLIYLTLSAIYLSIDNFLIRRNDKLNREWVKDLVEGRPIPDNMWWDDALRAKYPRSAPRSSSASSPSSSSSNAAVGLNRQMRRMDKKIKAKQDKDERLRQQRTEAYEAKKKAKGENNP